MSVDRLSITSILNAASDLVRRVATPWGALLLIAALPFRFLQAEFVERLIELGPDAKHYANALRQTATMAILAFVLLAVARMVFVRACRLAQSRDERLVGRTPLKLPASGSLSHLAAALVLQTISILFALTVIAIPITAIFAGVIAASFEQTTRPSITNPFRLIARYTREGRTLVGLSLIFFVAALVTWINLYFAFAIGLWMAHGFGGFDITRWNALMTPDNRIFTLLLIAGTFAFLEPFWLAVHVIYVQRVDARRSGDDLRNWFALLFEQDRSSEPAMGESA